MMRHSQGRRKHIRFGQEQDFKLVGPIKCKYSAHSVGNFDSGHAHFRSISLIHYD